MESAGKRGSRSWHVMGLGLGLVKGGLVGLGIAAGTAGAFVGTLGLRFDSMQEQSTIAFTSMLGSAAKATKMMRTLNKFAADTPFEFQQVTQAARLLMAMHVAETPQGIIKTLTAIGDAASGLGLGAEGVDRITRALGQMHSKGVVQADEMLQLTEAGIPAWDILAKKLGVTIPKAMDMVTKKKVPASMAVDALLKGMESRFPHMMDKQAKSMAGLWSTLSDTAKIAAGSILQPFIPAIKSAEKALIGWLGNPNVQKEFQALGITLRDKLGRAIQWLADVAWPAVERAWDRVGPGVIQAAKDYGTVWKTIAVDLWPALRDLAKELLPIVGAAFVVLGRVLHWLASDEGKKFISLYLTPLKVQLRIVRGIVHLVKLSFEGWGKAIQFVLKWINKILHPLGVLKDQLGEVAGLLPGIGDGGGGYSTIAPGPFDGGNGIPPGKLYGSGGVTLSAGPAMVFDRGPEIIDLPSGTRITPATMGGLGPLTVQFVVDRRILAEATYRDLADRRARA